MPNVKGSILLSRLDFVRTHFGEDGLEKLTSDLSEDDRRTADRLLPAQWYPFEFGERLEAAVMSVLGQGSADTFRQLGARSADVNLAGVHAVFVHADNPHGLLRRAPAIYKLYYDTGYRTYEKIDDQACRLVTYDSESYSRADCLTVIGWHERAVELCGGVDVRIDHPRCRADGADVCEYEISWRLRSAISPRAT